jgi:Gtp-binding protein of the ras superfamily involved in termination of M-phase
MEPSTPTDYPADGAYSPHIVNEQDQSHEDLTAVQNGHQFQSSLAATSTPPTDGDSHNRYNSPSLYQQPNSRPDSGMGGHQPSQYQEAKQSQSQPTSKSSVVIKVGMVGDAQIGKTSLMVKYVEGSWDEDYIQTLGSVTPSLVLADLADTLQV